MSDEKILEKLEILEEQIKISNQSLHTIRISILAMIVITALIFIALTFFVYNYAVWWRLS